MYDDTFLAHFRQSLTRLDDLHSIQFTKQHARTVQMYVYTIK